LFALNRHHVREFNSNRKERIPLINLRRGIFKPRQMRFLLSIKTVFPKPGGNPPAAGHAQATNNRSRAWAVELRGMEYGRVAKAKKRYALPWRSSKRYQRLSQVRDGLFHKARRI
jgi:hypothetical protein